MKISSNMSKATKSLSGYADIADEATSYLFIDKMNNNKLYQVQLVRNDGQIIRGIFDGSFGFKTSASYEDSMKMPELADTVNEFGNIAKNASSSDTGQFLAQSIRMTEARWTGCSIPSFSIKINIPVIRPDDSYKAWEALRLLLKSTTASREGDSGMSKDGNALSESVIYAPDNYKITYGSGYRDDKMQGGYSILIGNWFNAGQMVLLDVDHDFGSARLYTGDPLMYSITATFRFWRLPTYEDVIDWFPLMEK